MSKTKAGVSIVLIAAALGGAGWAFPVVRHTALKAVGRGQGCPWRDTFQVARDLQLLTLFRDQILQASKVVEKDPAGYHLVETPHGRWWIPAGNDFVLPFNLAEQARDIYGDGGRGIRPGDIALDCGANVGVWTRTALDHGAKLVVAFEPAPENIESYRRNFQPEISAGTVVLVPKGVWDKDDTLLLRRDPNNSAADSFVELKDKTHAVEAPLTTIDKVVADLKLPRVDYIKMDVEGAEERALHGANATLRNFHPRLAIAAEHLPTDAVRLPAAVRAAWPGYSMVCGGCFESEDGHIRPDVLFFQ